MQVKGMVSTNILHFITMNLICVALLENTTTQQKACCNVTTQIYINYITLIHTHKRKNNKSSHLKSEKQNLDYFCEEVNTGICDSLISSSFDTFRQLQPQIQQRVEPPLAAVTWSNCFLYDFIGL